MGLIISGLMLVTGFLGFLNSFNVLAQTSCLRANPGLSIISPQMDLFIILVCLLIAWLIALLQKNSFSIRHVGTYFYGREKTNQGYITTKWLVFGFPILPVRSYNVLYKIKEVALPDIEYQRNAMQPIEGYLYLPQVFRTAAISYGTMLWCWGCLWIMFYPVCLK